MFGITFERSEHQKQLYSYLLGGELLLRAIHLVLKRHDTVSDRRVGGGAGLREHVVLARSTPSRVVLPVGCYLLTVLLRLNA